MAGPLDAKTSPVANLFRSASLKTETDRRSLIGSALTVARRPIKPIAVATTVKNSLCLATHRRKEGGTVLKVWNRTLVRSERQLYAKGLVLPFRSRDQLQTETVRIRSVQRFGASFSRSLTRTLNAQCRTLNVFAGASVCLTYVHFRPMDAELKAMVDAGNLNVKAAAALDQLKPQTFCLHKSWGFGQISSWNLLLNQIVVDFDTKKNHAMQLLYAAETLQPLARHAHFRPQSQ